VVQLGHMLPESYTKNGKLYNVCENSLQTI